MRITSTLFIIRPRIEMNEPDHGVQRLGREVKRTQIEEVRRRIAAVESGVVRLIPGEQALAEVRGFVVLAGVRLTRVNRLCGRDQES
jgi:hypothetical protein